MAGAYLEEQVKQRNEMIEKWIKKVNTLEEHIKFLEGKVAVTEAVSKLLVIKRKQMPCRAYFRKPCLIVSGVKKNKWKYRKPDRNHH